MWIDTLKGIKRIAQQNKHKETLTSGPYSFMNWWAEEAADDWFTRFMRFYYPDNQTPIRFYSVFGPKIRYYYPFSGTRIFYSGENLEQHLEHDDLICRTSVLTYWKYRVNHYGDYNVKQADLSLGLGYREQETGTYLRFPEWIPFTFEPDSSYQDIVKRVQDINESFADRDAGGAVLIASHDDYGTRERICRDLDQILPVTYGGKWRRNSSELQDTYGDDKILYLKRFRFNICPENVDAPGYCTEKLFDAFRAGCIPVYHGSGNQPEPDIINKEAVIFWNYAGSDGEPADNEANIQLVRNLNEHEDSYQDFIHQKKLRETAPDYVWDRMMNLKNRIGELIQ